MYCVRAVLRNSDFSEPTRTEAEHTADLGHTFSLALLTATATAVVSLLSALLVAPQAEIPLSTSTSKDVLAPWFAH